MDRTGHDNEVLKRLLAAAPAPCLLTGPVASGKTSLALATAEHYSDDTGTPGGWLLAPNAVTAAALRRRLLQRSPAGVLVAPPVLTFRSLAERILTAADDRPATHYIDPLHRTLLLRRIVSDLLDADELHAFAAVADTPGLVASLDRSISELKRAAADPADLDAAFTEPRGKTHDLLAVYRRYQQHLQADNLCDAEGLMWLARDALQSQPDADVDALGLAGLRALAVDGFTDFTPTQLEILSQLAARVETLLITLPWADDSRDRMWQWTQRTRNAVRNAFTPPLVELALPDATTDRAWQPVRAATSVSETRGAAGATPRTKKMARPTEQDKSTGPASLAESVFTYRDDIRTEAAGIAVIEAASIEAEVAAVARRVKRLLVEGAPAGSIAVLARSQDAYRPTIERLFRECDIPVAPAAAPLASNPAVRFLLAAAELPAAGFASEDVLATIKNSYFIPAALGEYTPRTVAVAEMLIREGNVVAGRDSYGRAAERLARRLQQPIDPDNDEPADAETQLGPLQTTQHDLATAAAMLDALFSLVDVADESPRDRLLRLLDALQIRHVVCRARQADLVARDLRAVDRLAAVLTADTHWPSDPAMLREALSQVSLAPPRNDAVVDVLSVLDARNLRWSHVFLLGCSEGQFPQAYREGALLGEGDRREWITRGVALDRRRDLTAREMLLFYLALGRAETSLTLSYLSADAGGEACGPGPFLQTCLEHLQPADDSVGCVESSKTHLENEEAQVRHRRRRLDAAYDSTATDFPSFPSFQKIPPGQFIPPADEIASPRDALAAAMAGHFSDEQSAHPATLAWAGEHAPHLLAHAAMGLWAGHRRWQPGPCDAFDGRLDDPALLESLRQRYPAKVHLSASRLSTFGQCRWHYFGRYVCHLQPLAEPQRQLEPVGRGLFMHNLLFRVYRGLANEHGLPLRLWQLDEATVAAALDAAFEAECSRVDAMTPPYPALWKLQREQLRADALGYLLAERSDPFDLRTECLHFELGFGVDNPGDLLDPASVAEPIRIKTEAGPIDLVGKIDRLDRVHVGDRSGLLVIDYKTGRLPKYADALDGTNVQMPLYTEAVRELSQTDEPCLGGAFCGVNGEAPREYFAAMQLSRGKLKENDAFDADHQAALQRVAEFIRAMQAGHFDLLPHPEPSRYDDFREIDHHSPARDSLKQTLTPSGEEAAP